MDMDLKHYVLPEWLRLELERADAMAARLQHQRMEAPDTIELTGPSYNTALTILPQPMPLGARVTWRGRKIARAA